MQQRIKKRRKNSPFRTLYFLLVILLIGMVVKQEWNIYKVNSAKQNMQATVDALQQTQNDLKQEISNLHDLSYIESVARSEYKMIKPNEIPIIIKE